MRVAVVGLAALALIACQGRRTPSGGPAVTTGARLTKLQVTKPTSLAAMWNLGLEGGLPNGTIVLLIAADPQPGTARIFGGTGSTVADDPGTYTFAETLTPAEVMAETTARSDGRTDFTTETAFDWELPFNPVDPWLPLHHGVLTGSLDPQGVPTSDVPALSGTLRGCFTTAEAQALFIPQLSVTVYDLATMSGDQPDTACGSGTIDGFAFEGQWEATEVVSLVDAG